MKNSLIIFSLLILVLFSCEEKKIDSSKKNNEVTIENKKSEMHHNMQLPDDNRLSLNVTGKRAKHQLMNMRDHVDAVNLIIAYLSKDQYENASEVANKRLGLSDQMKMMCSSFGNKEFEELGFAFHKSAETMAEVFKTKDKNKSLQALSTTMTYCVSCHAKFKQ